MAYIELNATKLAHNYQFLESLFLKHNITWAAVSKLLCGTESYLDLLLQLGVKEVCDSRISNLAKIKNLRPEVQTVYIKPPARDNIEDIVRFADASFNTEFETIHWLSEEAGRQNKKHKIIIMIEMGDLREGVMGDALIDFYEQVFLLPDINVTGIGTNLNCLYGVMPTTDKLVQLCLYKQLIEVRFGRQIPWVTGGTSVTIPLLLHHQVPAGVNHFRVGETLFFGSDLFRGGVLKGMHSDVFTLHAQIIEIAEKPKNPSGPLDTNPSGERFEIIEADYGKSSFRAILDFGLLDSKTDQLYPIDKQVSVCGATSDMVVLELGENKKMYRVGDHIAFTMGYMGALPLFNSWYIEKRIVGEVVEG